MDELAGGGGGGPGMAAPPRQQQGPGGNLSLSPGGNGVAGGGGPPASEGAGPPAGPELSRPQQYTIPGILHYIQHEWARFEMERAHWEVERAELQVPRWGRCAGRWPRRGSWCGGGGAGAPFCRSPRLGEAERNLPVRLGGDGPGDGWPRGPLPLSHRSSFPNLHWLRGAGFLGAAILAFSMASAGAPPGLGAQLLSARVRRGAAGHRVCSCLFSWRWRAGLGMSVFPSPPHLPIWPVWPPSRATWCAVAP